MRESRMYICVLAIGLPIDTAISILLNSVQVISAATSEEPYKLSKTLFGNFNANSRANSSDKASPLVTQSFSEGSLLPMSSTDSSKTRSNEGTSTQRETWFSASVLTNNAGSRKTSSGIITLGIPCSRGPKISQTESTKLSAVF